MVPGGWTPDFSCRQLKVLVILLKEKLTKKIKFQIIEFQYMVTFQNVKKNKKLVCYGLVAVSRCHYGRDLVLLRKNSIYVICWTLSDFSMTRQVQMLTHYNFEFWRSSFLSCCNPVRLTHLVLTETPWDSLRSLWNFKAASETFVMICWF